MHWIFATRAARGAIFPDTFEKLLMTEDAHSKFTTFLTPASLCFLFVIEGLVLTLLVERPRPLQQKLRMFARRLCCQLFLLPCCCQLPMKHV